jgi:hypothetical protein
MSVLGLVLLSMTPIAAMGILLAIGRFEHYLLEGSDADHSTGVGGEVPQAGMAPQKGLAPPAAKGVPRATRPAA